MFAGIAVVIGMICLADGAWRPAAAMEGALRVAQVTVAGWQVRETGSEKLRFVAVNPRYPGLEIPLRMEAPVDPVILEWVRVPRYPGIWLLQYDAGRPATPELASIINNVIVDVDDRRVVAIAPFKWNGDAATWTWNRDAVTVTDPWGDTSITYPLRD